MWGRITMSSRRRDLGVSDQTVSGCATPSRCCNAPARPTASVRALSLVQQFPGNDGLPHLGSAGANFQQLGIAEDALNF